MTDAEGERGPGDAVRVAASDWWSTMRGEPTAEERARFDAWLAEDTRHGDAYEGIVRRWSQIEPTNQTPHAARRTLSPSTVAERNPYLVWGGITAIAAAALGVVAIETDLLRRTPDAQPVRYAATTSRRAVRLADRSAIALMPGTVIEATLTPDGRAVRMTSGTARFDVAHDAGRPFVVATPNGSITVRGTMFDLSVSGSTTRVSLLRGSVIVRGNGSTNPAVVLRPGESAVVVRGQPVKRAAHADFTPAAKMVVLDGVPLRTAIARVAGAEGGRLTVAAEVPANLRMTGAFRPGDLDGLARAAVVLFGLRLARSGEGYVLAQQ